MSEQILSQDEVDALLQGIAGDAETPEAEETRSAGGVRSYDLSSQEKIVRGRMPNLEIINERFARNIRIGLFNLVHKNPEISIGGIKVQKYSAFLREIVVPTNFNIMSVQPLRGSGLIVCDPSLVFAVVDALFGGTGKFRTRIEGRDFSPTEQRIIQRLVEVVTHEYERAWHGVYPLQLEYQRSEMLPQFASIATPSEVVVCTSFALEIGETSGSIHFCIPYSTLEPIRDVLYSTVPGRRQRAGPALGEPDEGQIQEAEVELVVELAHAPGHGRAAARLQARRLHRTRPAARHPGQGRRRAGVRLPLRNLERQVRAQGRSTVDRPEQRLDRREPCPLTRPRLAAARATRPPPTGPPPPPARGRRAPRSCRGPADQVSPAPFANFSPTAGSTAGNDINMILDIPVQLTVELGRTRIAIKNILQLAQGSVVELEAMAGEPMDVLVNGYLIAQGEVVVVNEKFGIRLTDIVTPSERMRRLSRA